MKTLILYVGVLLLLGRCGSQTPAFKEDKSYTGTKDSDASKKNGAGGSSGAEGGDSTKCVETNCTNPEYGPGSEKFSGFKLASQNFTQNLTSKIDILWIVDTSGSMSEEQSYLGTNFNSFITQLAGSGIDFQTAVTTTDICQSQDPSTLPLEVRYCPVNGGGSAETHLQGAFVKTAGNPSVLKSSTANLVSLFNTYANQGVNGSGFEHGLKAAEMAIEKSATGENEALIRSDAYLSVIVVSDEEDDGIGLGTTDSYNGQNYVAAGLTSFRYTDDDFINYVRASKGNGKFSVSTITGTRNADGTMCTSPHSQPMEEGSQYINAATKTGGIVQSICETNWSASLSAIGKDVVAQASQFVLSSVPVDGSIKVWINGVLATNWTYSAPNNAVRFDPEHMPPNGSTIAIKFFTN